ncbi:hypothetical protein Shyhy01_42010 [Streptomyces hygroscopicus subsp. hygroscopicus]|nr:hypothetical protein [Streptomyces hygroscopicus]GLX51251.1 hypothetical protein Shyhy01_42010 [Streptomyces hygroscopicus subsp. hygroscopicus]
MTDLERIRAERVAHFRVLDEDAASRHCFRHADEEGGLWYFEAVPDRGELVVIRQAELTPNGRLHRYGWEAQRRRKAPSRRRTRRQGA